MLMQIVALPIAVAAGLVFFFSWHQLLELEAPHIPDGWQIVWQISMIVSFPLLILVHEFLHAIVFPGYGIGKDTLIGCWPSRMLFYAFYDGPMSRERFLLVFAMPFLVISVLPLCIAATVPLPEIVTSILAWFSIWNAIFACGDMLGFGLLLFQVPRRSIVRNKGWRSFWTSLSVESP